MSSPLKNETQAAEALTSQPATHGRSTTSNVTRPAPVGNATRASRGLLRAAAAAATAGPFSTTATRIRAGQATVRGHNYSASVPMTRFGANNEYVLPTPVEGHIAPPPGFEPRRPHLNSYIGPTASEDTGTSQTRFNLPLGRQSQLNNLLDVGQASEETPTNYNAATTWSPVRHNPSTRHIWDDFSSLAAALDAVPMSTGLSTMKCPNSPSRELQLGRGRQDDRVFHPMNTVQNSRGPRNQLAVVPTWETIQRIAAGFSPNYQGNIHIERNRSADIPATENCSLFLIGLPADITTHHLLSNIRRIGRIYATHINPPEPEKNHHLSAAKVIFFEVEAARKFFDQSNINGFIIDGQKIRVVHNRIRSAESTDPKHSSRVLLIFGPRAMVNPDTLTKFFKSKLEFQVDEILALPAPEDKPGYALIEYRFGSYRCQAQAAKMALSREFPDDVRVYYGPDPCA